MAGLLGRGGGLRGHGELPLNADINVTSLVDVAFVLLIIFMITAPIMQGGVDVQLPRAEARPMTAAEGLVVSVDREGRIFLEDTPVSSWYPIRLRGRASDVLSLLWPDTAASV